MITITLDNEQVIEILNINIRGGQVDWKRTEGYTGDCVSQVEITSWATMQAEIKAAIEADMAIDI